jgi:hypothetical protein
VATDAVQLRRQAKQHKAQRGSQAQQDRQAKRQAKKQSRQQHAQQTQQTQPEAPPLQQPKALSTLQQEEAAGLGGMWSVLAMSVPAFGKRYPSFEGWQAEKAGATGKADWKKASVVAATSC